MKKKLASLIVVVALLVSMLSTTVFADTESSKKQLDTIKSQMQETAEYLANIYVQDIASNNPNKFEFLYEYSSLLYYLNKSGIESDDLDSLNNTFVAYVKAILEENQKLGDATHEEDIFDYFSVIMGLLSIGEDPTKLEIGNTNYDLVARLNTLLKDPDQYEDLYEDFDASEMTNFEPVFSYYKDNYDSIATEYSKINERVLSFYIKSGMELPVFVSESEVSTLGIDKVLDSSEYDIEYGVVILSGDDDAAWSALVDKLNKSTLPEAGNFSNDDAELCLNRLLKDGFIGANGFGPTADARNIIGLVNFTDDINAYKTFKLDDPQTTVTANEAVTTALTTIHNVIDEKGLAHDDKLGEEIPPFNCTSMALIATSVFNRLGDADMLYEGLNTFRLDDGSYKRLAEQPIGTTYATEMALTALEAYYYEKAGIGNVFDLSITDLTVDPDTPLEMKEVATHDWVVGSDFGFTVSSPANFASFWDVVVDGSSAIAGPAQVGADGVSTYAAVGGGSMRVETGSTIVTLSPEYLATLAPGEHTIRVQSANGYAETTLNIVATPQTGDSEGLGLFVTLTACGLGMAVVAVMRKAKAER